MTAGFSVRLKKALAGRSQAQLNEFQFLNLDMVKAETGDRWIEVRKKVYGVAAHFVEKRMHADDMVVRCRGGFILIFAHLSAEDSQARLEAISHELNLFFLGDRILKNLEICSQARKVDAAEFAQFIQRSSSTEPRAAMQGDRRRADADETADPNGPNWQPGETRGSAGASLGREVSSPVPESVARWVRGEPGSPSHAARLQPEAGGAVRQTTGWQSGPARRADVPHYQPGMASSCKSDPQLGHWTDIGRQVAPPLQTWRAANMASSASYVPGVARPVAAETMRPWDDIVFKPCWDSQLNEITSNICLARRFKDGKVLYGRDALLGSDAADQHRALDRAVAIAAQRGYQQVHAQGKVCRICIPVHYDTIRSVADRVSYFSILQVVPPHLRQHFSLRVDQIPAGAPISQMQDLFRSMKWFGSNLLATIRLDETDLSPFEGCGIDTFCIQMPVSIRTGNISDDQIETLGRSVKAVRQSRASTFLTRVKNFDGLVAGLSAGARLFAGEAIGPETALPAPRRDASFIELVERSEAMRAFDQQDQRAAG